MAAGDSTRYVVSLRTWKVRFFEILAEVTQDLSVWASLSRFQPDMFCGLMSSSNDGTLLSTKALIALGERGISLALDVYDADDELSGAEQ